jgi:hypothetical protein
LFCPGYSTISRIGNLDIFLPDSSAVASLLAVVLLVLVTDALLRTPMPRGMGTFEGLPEADAEGVFLVS